MKIPTKIINSLYNYLDRQIDFEMDKEDPDEFQWVKYEKYIREFLEDWEDFETM
jgi:hypothetical protein